MREHLAERKPVESSLPPFRAQQPEAEQDGDAVRSQTHGYGASVSELRQVLQSGNRVSSAHVARSLLQMQRTYGNRYVQRFLALARQGEGEAEVTPEVESAIERSRGGGQALDTGVRRQMEAAFGSDFGGVRIHTGSESHLLNRAVNAIAFTTGRDIFFSDGAYVPQSSGGRGLLAHELTHVVQQGGSSSVQGKLVVGEPNDQYEQEADRVSKLVSSTLDSAAVPEAPAADAVAPVQRQCACGGQTASGAECEECRMMREAGVQHGAPVQRQGDGDTAGDGLSGQNNLPFCFLTRIGTCITLSGTSSDDAATRAPVTLRPVECCHDGPCSAEGPSCAESTDFNCTDCH